MGDATGLAEALLGVDGFRALAVEETAAEVVIRIASEVANRCSAPDRSGRPWRPEHDHDPLGVRHVAARLGLRLDGARGRGSAGSPRSGSECADA